MWSPKCRVSTIVPRWAFCEVLYGFLQGHRELAGITEEMSQLYTLRASAVTRRSEVADRCRHFGHSELRSDRWFFVGADLTELRHDTVAG